MNVEDGASDLSNGYSETHCNPGGDAELPPGDASTGTESQFANAPINKYYCNLMNALGVKAGADGFPAVGGTAEVTHFGMYDRTADYVGGGIIEPMIHDPGGFDALKVNS